MTNPLFGSKRMIFNKTISMMLVTAYRRLKADGDSVTEELSIHNGLNDTGVLSVKAKQTGAVIRTYWTHDGCRITKREAIRIMRNHEETMRTLSESEYIGLKVCISCSGRFGELKTSSNSLLSKAYYVECASCGAKTSGYDRAASAVKEWNSRSKHEQGASE